MRRRTFLAGLLGFATPAALLEGPTFHTGGQVPDGRMVNLHRDEGILNRRGVLAMGELEGGSVALGGGAVWSRLVRHSIRRVASPHWRSRS